MTGTRHHEPGAVIGVDLGATKIKAARIGGTVEASTVLPVSAQGTEDQVVDEVIDAIQHVWSESVEAIGVGAPSVVNPELGIVYDVQNIPSWVEVPLKEILEKRFDVPVRVNNDANCFALGEKYYGKAQGYRDVVGLIIGTGMAAGIIVNNNLYNGQTCGAGEIGMIQYLDHHYEYYCSGQYFENVHRTSGEELFVAAEKGNAEALKVFTEYGHHLGAGLKMVLYAFDPEMIVLGGSVSKSFRHYQAAMYSEIQTFAYRPVLDRLNIQVSDHPDVAVLGAAALTFNDATLTSSFKAESVS